MNSAILGYMNYLKPLSFTELRAIEARTIHMPLGMELRRLYK
jgi:hypothetical protein